MLSTLGYRLVRIPREEPLPYDMDPEFKDVFERTKPYSLTSAPKMYSLYKAIQYVTKYQIPGDFVECGVWRGGSSMMAALTFIEAGDTGREMWLYDTYGPRPEPTDKDVRARDGLPASEIWTDLAHTNTPELDDVRSNMESTRYPKENIWFIQGKVEDTIPATMPGSISVLRLDTDWYEFTYHELKHLFPVLSPNGILIIDDYGWYRGAREATDQYFDENNIQIFLHRIDLAGRMAFKGCD